MASYKPGISPPSFDKQFVRDYLESLHWNKKPPAPHLPPDILARTSDNYREALRLLTALERERMARMFKWLERLEDGLFKGRAAWARPGEPCLRWLRYPAALIRDWLRGEISIRAMSLAYTTLLSLVPLLVFSFAILKGLGARGDLKFILHEFFAPMGGAATQLTESVLQFVRNMRGDLLGSIGLLFLVTPCRHHSKGRRGALICVAGRTAAQLWPALHRIFERHDLGPHLLAVALGLLGPPRHSLFAQWVRRVAPLAWT